MPKLNRTRIDVLHAVTASISLVLMRGQLSYLRHAGFTVAALCNPGSEIETLRAKEDVPVYPVRMRREISPLRDLSSLVRLCLTLRRLRPLICNTGTPKAGLLVGLAAWLNRVPCRVYTMRGLRLETASGAKRLILGFSERIACACAHRVVCVSPSLRQRAVDLRLVAANKAIVLGSGSSNGVDTEHFKLTPERMQDAAQLRSELGLAPADRVIGYVGRLTRDKGLAELITAFESVKASFPDAVLLLVGSYEDGDPVPLDIRRTIASDPRVVRLEFTTDVARCYALMELFVLPTHREGFPNTVLEAQACERPVVTTSATGAIDSVQDGVTGFIVPVNNPASLAAAMLRLLSDRGLSQEMGRAGRERVCREFRRQIAWEELAQMYRDLLSARNLPLPVGHVHDN